MKNAKHRKNILIEKITRRIRRTVDAEDRKTLEGAIQLVENASTEGDLAVAKGLLDGLDLEDKLKFKPSTHRTTPEEIASRIDAKLKNPLPLS